jgi:hypothetical protein
MKKVEVFIPTEKDEQHKIAMVLGALDGLIENITKINQNLIIIFAVSLGLWHFFIIFIIVRVISQN